MGNFKSTSVRPRKSAGAGATMMTKDKMVISKKFL